MPFCSRQPEALVHPPILTTLPPPSGGAKPSSALSFIPMLALFRNPTWTLRLTAALTALLVLILLVRCSSGTARVPPPRADVTAFFDQLKNGDYDSAKKAIYLVPKPLFGAYALLRDMHGSSAGRWNWAAQIYTVSNLEQKGDTATATVQTLAVPLDPTTLPSSVPTVSYSATLDLTYSSEEKRWKFIANKKLVQALLGGQLSSLQALAPVAQP